MCVCVGGGEVSRFFVSWILFNNTPHTNMIDHTLYAYFSTNKASY